VRAIIAAGIKEEEEEEANVAAGLEIEKPVSNSNEDEAGTKAKALDKAAKSMRLRLMKARNENYLAERREERETDEDVTKELSLDHETVSRRT
jgi:hypothetical protein